MRILVWHNWKRFPLHLISDYTTIIRIMSLLFSLSVLYALYQYNCVYWVSMEATNYLHELPVCGWGVSASSWLFGWCIQWTKFRIDKQAVGTECQGCGKKIFHLKKLGSPSWFINQPDCLGPKSKATPRGRCRQGSNGSNPRHNASQAVALPTRPTIPPIYL